MENFDFINATPPHSLETEQAVLGRLLTAPDGITEVVDFLKPEHFYSGHHRVIYTACCELFKTNEQVNIVSVPEWIRHNSDLSQAGSRAYIHELGMNYYEIGFELQASAKIVRDYAICRSLIVTGYNVVSASYQLTGAEAIDYAQKQLTLVQSESETVDDKSTSEIIDSSLQQLEARLINDGKAVGLTTGFSSVDNLLGGFRDSDLIILAARPSMGKTALLLNICANVAIRQNLPVLFFSIEMSGDLIGERLLSSEAETTCQRDKLSLAADRVKAAPLEIIDRPTITLSQLRAVMRRKLNQYGSLSLVGIDYLQLLHEPGENRVQEVSRISRGLKILAKEFKTPILCLSQLSRAVEARQDKRPMLSDLRESGSIEQDADIVMFIYRDEYYNKETAKRGTAEIIVAKHRNGAVGSTELLFRPGVTKFLEARNHGIFH